MPEWCKGPFTEIDTPVHMVLILLITQRFPRIFVTITAGFKCHFVNVRVSDSEKHQCFFEIPMQTAEVSRYWGLNKYVYLKETTGMCIAIQIPPQFVRTCAFIQRDCVIEKWDYNNLIISDIDNFMTFRCHCHDKLSYISNWGQTITCSNYARICWRIYASQLSVCQYIFDLSRDDDNIINKQLHNFLK